MTVGGIDPGLKGAVASWDGRQLTLLEIPAIVAASGKGREVDWSMLRSGLDLLFSEVGHFFVEKVWPLPKQSSVAGFKQGFVAGGIRGLLAASRTPLTYVPPTTWKKAVGASADKRQCVSRACEIFPKHAELFRGPQGGLKDGLAEAALIAWYGHGKLNGA